VSNCKEYKNLIQSALDGTADEREMRRLEGHTALCSECARELKVLQIGIDLLASTPVQEPCEEFTLDTVKKAFAAKKKQRQRQKMVSWGLSGLTAITSVLILAGWNMAVRPAIKGVLSNIMGVILEWRILLKAFEKILAALIKELITSGNNAVSAHWEGFTPVISGYMIALIIMAFFILITGVKSSTLSFRRR
jgi:anti-sigma factor RsiW